MSTLRAVVVCAVGLTLAAVAVAGNDIRQWAGPAAVIQDELFVRIVEPGTYGFEALDPNAPAGLGYFQGISVDPNCPTGTINLYIARDPSAGGGPGATDVYYLALLNAPNVTVNIAEMRVTQNLPAVQATATTGPVVASTISSVTVATLAGDIECDSLGNVSVTTGLSGSPTITVDGDYGATMTFAQLPALIIAGDLDGDVTAGGAPWPVSVDGDLAGTFEVTGLCDPDITLAFDSISGALTLGQAEGDPFGATVSVSAGVANGAVVSLMAGLATSGTVHVVGTWGGALVCAGDLAGNVSAYAFDPNADLAVNGDLSGTLRAALDIRGTVLAEEISGLIDCGQDFYAALEAGEITADGELLIVRDFRGTILAEDVAGTIDVGRDYLGGLELEVGGTIASSGLLTVGNNWGASGGAAAVLYVPGTVYGQVSVVGDVANGYFEIDELGEYGSLEFDNDFYGDVWIPKEMAGASVLSVAGDVFPTSEDSEIAIGYYYGPGYDAVKGYLTVGNELHIPLEVAGVHGLGEIHIGSIPEANEFGINSLGVYGAVKGQVLVDGELDGECVIYAVETGGSVEVGGDMTALFEIMTYSYEPGYIDQGGLVRIDGALAGGCEVDIIYGGGVFEVGAVESDCTIHEFAGSALVGGDVAGDLTIEAYVSGAALDVTGDVAEDFSIDVDCAIAGPISLGDLWGTLYSPDELTDDGELVVGDVYGLLMCADGAEGPITVGNVAGTIDVGGPVPNERSATTARITVNGSIQAGGELIVGDLTDPGDPEDPNNPPLSGGYVIVNGSLEAGGQIIARQGIASDTSFIAINYSADANAYWDPNAPIILEHNSAADEVFYGNTPASRIWEISDCKADMNNNGFVSATDNSGFVAALVGAYGYSVGWPGLGGTAADNYLGGSRLFHADLNCDGYVTTQGDLNPYVTRVSQGCCIPECGECPGDSLGEWPDAETLAAQLEASISPELLDDFLSILEQYINGPDDPPERAFWLAVYEALIA